MSMREDVEAYHKYLLPMLKVSCPGRIAVIKGEEFLADYATEIEAMLAMSQLGHPMSSYIIRRVPTPEEGTGELYGPGGFRTRLLHCGDVFWCRGCCCNHPMRCPYRIPAGHWAWVEEA